MHSVRQWSPNFLAPGTGFLEDNFSMDRVWGGEWFRGWCEPWGAAGEALLTHPPLTSCCAARFLTGCGPVLVCSPGVGDPWCKGCEFRLHSGTLLRTRVWEIACQSLWGKCSEDIGGTLVYIWFWLGIHAVKHPPANAGDTGLSSGPGRSHMLWRN